MQEGYRQRCILSVACPVQRGRGDTLSWSWSGEGEGALSWSWSGGTPVLVLARRRGYPVLGPDGCTLPPPSPQKEPETRDCLPWERTKDQ